MSIDFPKLITIWKALLLLKLPQDPCSPSLISFPNIVLLTNVYQRSLEYKGKLKIFLKLPPPFLAPTALQFRYYPGHMSNWLQIIKCFKKYSMALLSSAQL